MYKNTNVNNGGGEKNKKLLSWARNEGTAVILKFKMWLYNNANYLKVTRIFVGLIYMFSFRGTKQIAKYSLNPADYMPLKMASKSGQGQIY